MQTFVAAVSCALVVSFICSIFESVLLTLSPAQVEALAASGSRAGRLMRSFKHRIDVPISAILIVNTIAHTIGAAVAGASYQNVFDPATLWIFSLVFTVAVLLFTEIIPKTLGVTHAERLAPPVAHGINGLIFLLRPAVAVTEKLSALLRGRAARPSTSVEEIRLLAQLGRSEGAVGERTAGMIVGATQLRELKADDVMLPRRQVVFLSAQDSTATVVERVRSSRHSRFPFTPTGSLDNFSGVVLAKELLQQLLDGAERINWEALIREPVVVPEAQPLNMLLRTFQEARKHMAMVVDEYGQCQGIVTIEDVLEEIVGDIIDESDVVRDTYAEDQDGRLQFSADLDLRSLAQRLGVAWDPRERAHSVNGLVTERLGRLPRVGDWIEWQGYRVEVTAVGERRADRIAVRKAQAIQPAPSAPDGPA
jgi:CBS domain containing-hemolysin-like protein